MTRRAGRVGGGKVAACSDSKEKVWYGDVWDEARSSRLRKSCIEKRPTRELTTHLYSVLDFKMGSVLKVAINLCLFMLLATAYHPLK